jgi:excisionase family DNA binding protein
MIEKHSSENFEPLIDAQEAASLLGCHPRTLLRKAREGAVPSIRVFDKVRFRASVLNDWLAPQGYNPSTVRAA